MNTKRIITIALLVFAVASVAAMIFNEMRTTPVQVETVMEEQQSAMNPGRQVVAYYFHGTVRCMTCRSIEAYTEEALKEGFANAINEGRLVWKTINTDEAGNEHFVTDYQLHTKSVVLSEQYDNQELDWKNLDQIWNLVSDKDAFITYIRNETGNMLGEHHG